LSVFKKRGATKQKKREASPYSKSRYTEVGAKGERDQRRRLLRDKK